MAHWLLSSLDALLFLSAAATPNFDRTSFYTVPDYLAILMSGTGSVQIRDHRYHWTRAIILDVHSGCSKRREAD